MLRRTLLAAAGSQRTRNLVEKAPGSRQIVKRYVAGSATDDAVAVADALIEDGLLATIDHLGEEFCAAVEPLIGEAFGTICV